MAEMNTPDEIRQMPFETALAELETLVGRMENGGMALEELMAGFERGKQLTCHCRSKLAALERKIAVLSRDDGGEGEWTDFAPGSSRNGGANDEKEGLLL